MWTVSPVSYWFWSCGAGLVHVIAVVQIAPSAAATPPADGPRRATASIEATAIQPSIRILNAPFRRGRESATAFISGPLVCGLRRLRMSAVVVPRTRAAACSGRMIFADRHVDV
jgi:hypothetical protein